MSKHSKVLLVGGGGYVGVELQRLLAESNYQVRVLDTFWYPEGKWNNLDGNFVKNIEYIDGDIRDNEVVRKALDGMDACIHLACISNDQSYELNQNLDKRINFELTLFRHWAPQVLLLSSWLRSRNIPFIMWNSLECWLEGDSILHKEILSIPEFYKPKINHIADKGYTVEVIKEITKIINGGANGLQDRISLFNYYYKELNK